VIEEYIDSIIIIIDSDNDDNSFFVDQTKRHNYRIMQKIKMHQKLYN